MNLKTPLRAGFRHKMTESGGKRKILVVDREQHILDLLREVLKEDGYEVLTALSYEAAINLMAEEDIGLVITCLRFPGMGGIELVHWMKANKPRIPVIVHSAVHATYPILDVIDGYVTKSSDLTELRYVVKRLFA